MNSSIKSHRRRDDEDRRGVRGGVVAAAAAAARVSAGSGGIAATLTQSHGIRHHCRDHEHSLSDRRAAVRASADEHDAKWLAVERRQHGRRCIHRDTALGGRNGAGGRGSSRSMGEGAGPAQGMGAWQHGKVAAGKGGGAGEWGVARTQNLSWCAATGKA
eukprot:358726-Chlamydomonas_euryale.AAC.8